MRLAHPADRRLSPDHTNRDKPRLPRQAHRHLYPLSDIAIPYSQDKMCHTPQLRRGREIGAAVHRRLDEPVPPFWTTPVAGNQP